MSERTPIVDSASTLTMGAALDEPVLLLNRLYAAVRIVSARRAFSLLCKQLANCLHNKLNARRAETIRTAA